MHIHGCIRYNYYIIPEIHAVLFGFAYAIPAFAITFIREEKAVEDINL